MPPTCITTQKDIIATGDNERQMYLQAYLRKSGLIVWTQRRRQAMTFGQAGLQAVKDFLQQKKVPYKVLKDTHLPKHGEPHV